jgi:uncharacterized protein GlcG (DUF336 family)
MRRIISSLALGVTAVFLAQSAGAQAPKPPLPSETPVTEKMPFDVPYGLPIDITRAQALIAAADAEAKKHSWKMNIAVVDPNGELIAFEKMDGAQTASVPISINKAYTAARFRRPTVAFADAMALGNTYVPTLDPRLAASPGGFPLVVDGKIIGAIGCSGGTGQQDGATCKAGADALK